MDLQQRLRDLKRRFFSIEQDTDEAQAESQVRAASIIGGKLIIELRRADAIPALIGLDLKLSEIPKWPPNAADHTWNCVWILSCIGIANLDPAQPSFPLAQRQQSVVGPTGDAEGIWTGATHRADWRIRAQNYASCCQWLIEQCDAAGADGANRAKLRKLFPQGVPDDADIRDLVLHLDTYRGADKSDRQIARDFTGETIGNEMKAKRLLARIGQMRRKGKVNLPKVRA